MRCEVIFHAVLNLVTLLFSGKAGLTALRCATCNVQYTEHLQVLLYVTVMTYVCTYGFLYCTSRHKQMKT
jgi:hypothetical protein